MPYSQSSELSSPTQNDERVWPSNSMPMRSSTIAEAGLSGCNMASTLVTPIVSNRYSTSADVASTAYPRFQASLARV